MPCIRPCYHFIVPPFIQCSHYIIPLSTSKHLTTSSKVLDAEGKGYLSQEEISKFMTEEGEPFTQEELEEMLSAAVDPEQGLIFYKDYVSVMAVDET